MDRRLAIIRCVLFCTLGVALFGWGWLNLGLYLVIVGLMMPAGILGGGGSPCACGNVGATETVTIAGVANSGCSTCGDWNKSWVLTGGLGICIRSDSFSQICGVYGPGTATYSTNVTSNRRGFSYGGVTWRSPVGSCSTMDDVVDLLGSPLGNDGTCNFTGSSATA